MFKVVRKSTSQAAAQPAKKQKQAESAVEKVPELVESEDTSAGGLAALMGEYSEGSD